MVDGVLRIDLPTSLTGTPRADSDNTLASECGTFVAGLENRLPALVLEKLLTGEGEFSTATWATPLVLIGPAGSGKSLLARGIMRRWLGVLGPNRAVYFTATDFARQLLAARNAGMLAEFRATLGKLQLLVMEDMHKLPARAALQHELRTLLDKLVESKATVLITSQVAPTAQPQLESGLADRLAEGLLLSLSYPSGDARLELLKLVAVERGTQIDERELRTIAESVAGPVPQLLRALRQWESTATLGTQPIPEYGQLSAKDIIAVVARYFGVTQAALRGPTRRKSLVVARNSAVFLMRALNGMSYAQIGKELGQRDHSTIMHSMATLQRSLTSDPVTQHTIEELRRILLAV